MKFAKILGAIALSLLVNVSVHAVPALQLDIVGGTYDPIDEDIITSATVFDLVAVLNPKAGNAPASNDTFYVAVSLKPKTTTAFPGGSFKFGSTTVNVTSDMVSGTPPGLPPHGQFPNFYKEFAFTFDLTSAGRVLLYNTQDDPGGPTFNPTGTAFAKLFTVDKSGLAPGWELHFDLYNKDRRGRVDINAPFSHDASTIPEPTGFLLTLGGLSLFACLRRMRG